MITKDCKWFVIKTRSNHEFKTVEYLRKVEIECFCPSKTEIKVNKNRVKCIERPLFSMYVFVRVSTQNYLEVLQYPSVRGMVSCAGVPEVIDDEQIRTLRVLLTKIEDYEIISIKCSIGESVMIQSGPYKGLKGEIISIKGKKRVMIRIPGFQYGIVVNTGDLIAAVISI